ncbi:MAG TPA: TonB-dependent receptor [Nitrospirota bacterium]|nr:TonB-dependent receptor [Nitrospirota bacterium]
MTNRTYVRSVLVLGVAALILSSTAGAHADSAGARIGEELSLFQDIPSVYSASKYEQKVTEAPSSVSIITAADIRGYGYRTLADILRSVRSFYVTYDRNYAFVGVRGFGRPQDYNNRIQLLIDGHRANDNLYDMAAIGTDAVLDVDLIDRIEIIRGPGSSLYGSSAFFAVVNVITKRGRDLRGTEISGEAASYDTYKGRLSYGNRFGNGVEAIVSGSLYDSKGRNLYYPEFDQAVSSDPRAANNNGTAYNADYDRAYNLFSKWSYHDLTIEGAYNSRTKGISSGVFDTDFNNSETKTVDRRGYLDMRYEHSLGPQTDLTARLFYDYYQYTGIYNSIVLLGIVNKDWACANGWGGELKLSSRLFDRHHVILGTEYLYNNQLDQTNEDFYPHVYELNNRRRSRVTALYAQDEYALNKNVTLFAGLRYDQYDTFGDTTNPRLALIFTPWERGVVKFVYGTAFRAPTPFELYYNSPTNIANPDLKPEKIRTSELVFEQYVSEHLRASASLFEYHISNLINQTEASPGVTVFKNFDQIKAHGIEVEIEDRWASGVEGRFSYTLQKATDSVSGTVLSNSPEHLAKLNVMLPLFRDALFAGIEEQYTGARKTRSGESVNDFVVTNLTFTGRRITPRLDVSASVYNLFDRKYRDPVSSDMIQQTIVQDGRNYRLKITYAF